MQNYWARYDWLTRAYPFKCVGTYESQILADFTDNHDAPASRHARLYLPLWICATAGQKPQGAVDEISWKSNKELVTLPYWDTWESWCAPASALPGTPPPVSSYCPSVRERPPRCLIRYIIRETAGRGCRQLTRGCRGRISCDFLQGWGFGLRGMFRSHVQWYPTETVEVLGAFKRLYDQCACKFQLSANDVHLDDGFLVEDQVSEYQISVFWSLEGGANAHQNISNLSCSFAAFDPNTQLLTQFHYVHLQTLRLQWMNAWNAWNYNTPFQNG